MSQPLSQSYLVAPSDGRRIRALDMVHKVGAEHLGGSLLLMEGVLAPGRLIPPHTHSREDECTYVLSGELSFEINGEVVTASAGSYVAKPRGIPHAFWNSGVEPARVIEIHAPGTFDHFYDELAAIFTATQATEAERRQTEHELHTRYGLTFHPERIPEFSARYGVAP